jgi:hypothetical protein
MPSMISKADKAACSSTSDPRYVEARAAGHAHR